MDVYMTVCKYMLFWLTKRQSELPKIVLFYVPCLMPIIAASRAAEAEFRRKLWIWLIPAHWVSRQHVPITPASPIMQKVQKTR